MKFIHAVIFDVDEFNNGNYNTEDWGDLCDGDYVVHCLYSIDNEEILIHEDNTHQPVETMIENFLQGVEFCGHDAIVTNAYIVVDVGLAYDEEATLLCLVEGAYVEVKD
jgi:hypothetical protein